MIDPFPNLVSCPFCDKNLGNADYRATLHTNAYHDLLTKIHELRQDYVIRPQKFIFKSIDDVLKSLLESEKE